MTPAQIRTVRASFARIEPALPQLGKHFYERLFIIAPELRSLFAQDMAAQEAKFITAVSELVNLHLRSLLSLPAVGGRTVGPEPAELHRDRAALGFEPEHFGLMRIAMLDILREEMGEHFTDAVEDAWMAAFDVLVYALPDGIGGAPAGRDRFLGRLSKKDAETAQTQTAAASSTLRQFFR